MRNAFARILQFAAAAFTLLIAPLFAIESRVFDQDPDIWWHIRVGDWITEHHAVPRFGIFSQHIERPWVAYSWLFDVLVSAAHKMFGLPGIPGLLICLEVLLSLVFLLAIVRIAGSFWWAWWIASAAIFAYFVNPLRPVLFTLLFFTLELLLIFESERRRDDKLLYWMGPLFVLWANCHIQFVYGIAVLGLYLATRILSLLVGRLRLDESPTASAAKLIGFFGIAVVGSCIGPNGWLPYKVAFEYAGQTFVYQIVVEMHAMDFRRPEHFVELLLLMAACFAIGRSGRRDLFRTMLLIVAAIVSFRSMRDAWFVSMAAAFVIAEAVRERESNATAEGASDRRIWEPIGYAAAVSVALALSFGFAIRRDISTPALINDIDGVYPIRATEFVRESNLQGPMYNSFNWGGFLIFNLRDQPVSIDPRTDLYGDDGVRRSVATTDAINWQADPDLLRANFVLVERKFPLASALANDPGYRLVYQDHLATVFVKQPHAP
ncbi:MAG: hypothetical protein ABSE45_06915 [Candidatus Acidiferrales bacterium]|jgi:hypothetical protein